MELLIALLSTIIQNNSGAITAVFSAVIVCLLYALMWLSNDRKQILKSLKAKDKKLEEIIENYYGGQTAVTEAMHSIKEVLIEVKTIIGVR